MENSFINLKSYEAYRILSMFNTKVVKKITRYINGLKITPQINSIDTASGKRRKVDDI